MNAAEPGAAPSCSCKAGYVANGDSCDPILTVLESSVGVVTPALGGDTLRYELRVPATTERLTLRPSAPELATVLIDDRDVVAPGSAWQTPLLDFGVNLVGLSVRQPGHPRRDYQLSIIRGHQEAYLKGSHAAAGSWQGYALAIDADTVVVGAPGDLNGTDLTGAAYVYARQEGAWTAQAHLQSDSPAVSDYFGAAVAISGDTMVIGAPGEDSHAGVAYVYTRDAGVWSKQARLRASNFEANDFFGGAVAVDRDTVVVGARYEASSATGVHTSVPVPENNALAGHGAAYVFTRSGSTWSQRAYLKRSGNGEHGEQFGSSLALFGSTLVVGAPYADVTYLGNTFGNSGSAYAFEGSGASWTERARWQAAEPDGFEYFGTSVAVDESTIVVGAPGQEKVYAYRHDPSAGWSGAFSLTPNAGDPYDSFGTSVAVAQDTVVVGAWNEYGSGRGFGADPADNRARYSGAIYIFVREPTGRREIYVKASNADAEDLFGASVALSGTTIAVGAPGESSRATTVNGDAFDNGATSSGAAYVLQ